MKVCKSVTLPINELGQVVSPNLHYITQHVHNECGTIAVFHALLNSITPIHKGISCIDLLSL